ncbi:MAG: translation initiation factor IF-2 [Alphaproteobacteria bacterium]|nr:translation initiation factor IF-2 [Alphaproteobacteria bacterium]
MTDTTERKDGKPDEPGGRKPLTLTRTTSGGAVRQSFPHGRTKQVAVEVKQTRVVTRPGQGAAPVAPRPLQGGLTPPPARPAPAAAKPASEAPKTPAARQGGLSAAEMAARENALKAKRELDETRAEQSKAADAQHRALLDAQERAATKNLADAEEAERLVRENEERIVAEAAAAAAAAEAAVRAERLANPRIGDVAPMPARREGTLSPARPATSNGSGAATARPAAARPMRDAPPAPAPKAPKAPKGGEPGPKQRMKLTLDMVERLAEGDDEKGRSLTSVRRAREKEKQRREAPGEQQRVTRDVVIPESITVQDLAARMAMRAADIIKFMFRQGTPVTLASVLDADTAQIVAEEYGHTVRRVSESDVEEGLSGAVDNPEDLQPRAPVVTVMGHVDHGKTSLLDALRQTDVVAGEAGGITQHIGAYQVRLKDGQRVTFLDTPGHAAFSSMRSRGAQVTDIVVLVVAADDGVMPQTIEAINHAKAAGVPIIVAVNKIDKHEADPGRVINELLQYDIVTEVNGGDVQVVNVSATKKTGLDQLVEAIALQAEVLELKANPNRPAEAAVIESRLDRGRGTVATVLVSNGTLKRGDIVVAGGAWGRVRALSNERGQALSEAGPATPVEIMGLEGVPEPGDTMQVVENEARAREVAEFRQRRRREKFAPTSRASFEQLMAKKESGASELPIIIKADVQGSAEAISSSLEKMNTDEVRARVLQATVGAISEADITLAKASGAPIIGFNVRASKEARDLAEREGVEIRYYAIIYNVIDDIKAVMSGMLAPEIRETFLGNAQVLEIFQIARIGRVAGCRITDGKLQKGARVRLVRENVVIHEGGKLNTLRRFKDDVNEVQNGQECGVGLENFQDIKQGDVIECYLLESVQRSL